MRVDVITSRVKDSSYGTLIMPLRRKSDERRILV